MPRIAFLLVFLILPVTCVAVDRSPTEPSPARASANRPEPVATTGGQIRTRQRQKQASSNASPILPGEYQPVEYLLISWHDELDTFLLDIIEATWNQAKLVIVIPPELSADDIAAELRTRDLRPEEVEHIVQGPINSPWIRDFGPIVVRTGDQRVLLDAHYYPGAPEDGVPRVLASAIWPQWATAELPIRLDGGNLLSDGTGRCFTTAGYPAEVLESRLEEDRPVDVEVLTRELRERVGCRELFILPPLLDESTGHVDMYLTLTGPGRALVGAYAVADDRLNALRLDAVASILQRAGVSVERVPMPDHWDDRFRTHTNALAVNNVVLVPVFPEIATDEARVLAIFKRAYPGREVIPIVSSDAIELEGAVHCATATIAAIPRVR